MRTQELKNLKDESDKFFDMEQKNREEMENHLNELIDSRVTVLKQ